MADSAYYQDLAGQVAVPEKGMASKQLLAVPGLIVSIAALAPGHELKEHTAPWPLILHVLEGEGTITAAGEAHLAQPGTWLHVEAKAPHAVAAKTALKLLLTLAKPG